VTAAGWYGVRCVFRWNSWADSPYEERITLWRADSLDAAIALAETEAAEYAAEHEFEYVNLAQAYRMDDDAEPTSGTEVFSLLRDSDLAPDEYLDTYFSTGSEYEEHHGPAGSDPPGP
jgi:hypothetical protein